MKKLQYCSVTDQNKWCKRNLTRPFECTARCDHILPFDISIQTINELI